MKTIVIIQARMASSRLPGKVLLPLMDRPIVEWVVSRARMARCVNGVLVATTTAQTDEPLEAWCQSQEVPCFRGSEFDVLDRVFQAARQHGADRVVRLTADCPLIDPAEIEHVCSEMTLRDVDFCANRLPPPWTRSYPIGLDTEVVSMAALERAWREAKAEHEREHVLPYLYQQPGRFRIFQVHTTPDYGDLRWTVDTMEDLTMLRALLLRMSNPLHAGWRDFLAVYQRHPQIQRLNAGIAHKKFDDVDQRSHAASSAWRKD